MKKIELKREGDKLVASLPNQPPAGKLEYRNGAIWGNPYLRVLRSELERYITDVLGADYLLKTTGRSELRKIKKEMAELSKRLDELQARKTKIETVLNTP